MESNLIPAHIAADLSAKLEREKQINREKFKQNEYGKTCAIFNSLVRSRVGEFSIETPHHWSKEELAYFENDIKQSGYDVKCHYLTDKYEDATNSCDVKWKY